MMRDCETRVGSEGLPDGDHEATIGPKISLLKPGEPSPVTVLRPESTSPFVLLCDHAGRRLPQALGDLGLPAAEFERHIAWDIGARGVTERLSAMLDAPAVLQTYSRLVIDCNRPWGHPNSIPHVSEATRIPGNEGLTEAQIEARHREIFAPYHNAIRTLLDRRLAQGLPVVPIAVHSFTPVYLGVQRPWHFGVLFDRRPALSHALLRLLQNEPDLVVGENEPYTLSQISDYTIPAHAEPRGLECLELEIRQDLIADDAGEDAWANRLAKWLPASLAAATP
jgi:predicted N-formylglutamate amidohydrolase